MKSWRETIRLTRPLREARLSVPPAVRCSDEHLRIRDQQSFERGWREAEEACNQDILRQRSELAALETGLLESLRQGVSQLARDSETGLVALAMEVAHKLVASLPISVDMIEAAIREALQEAEQNGGVTILLHPADLELLQAGNSVLFQTRNDGETIHFHDSVEVTRGGCLVRTSFGTIDGRRETKFQLLKRSLAA